MVEVCENRMFPSITSKLFQQWQQYILRTFGIKVDTEMEDKNLIST